MTRYARGAKRFAYAAIPILTLAFSAWLWLQFEKADQDTHKPFEAQLKSLRMERLDHVRIWPWQECKETPLELPREYWPALIQHLQKLKPVRYPNGGAWTTYRAIDVEFNRVERYRIYIQTREGEGNEGRLFASFRDLQVFNETYFDGRDLWTWMISVLEIKNQPGCPLPPS